MANKVLSMDDFYGCVAGVCASAYTPSSLSLIGEMGPEMMYFGNRVIRSSGKMIVFEKCDYCGQNQPVKGLYDYWFCGCCGAPIS